MNYAKTISTLALLAAGCGAATNDRGEPISTVPFRCQLSRAYPNGLPPPDEEGREDHACAADGGPTMLCIRRSGRVTFHCMGHEDTRGLWWDYEGPDEEPVNDGWTLTFTRGTLTEHDCRDVRSTLWPLLCMR